MAACAAAGVGFGSDDEGSDADSWDRRKSSGGRSVHRLSISCGGKVSTYGTVVFVVRRSGKVVNGLSTGCWREPPEPELRELRKF